MRLLDVFEHYEYKRVYLKTMALFELAT
jgi:hypothetical protein